MMCGQYLPAITGTSKQTAAPTFRQAEAHATLIRHID